MSINLQSLLCLMWFGVLCMAEVQLFEQSLTNLAYKTHIESGNGRDGNTSANSNVAANQRAPQQIIEPAQLHQELKEITGSDAMATLLKELLSRIVPNMQTQQQHQQIEPRIAKPPPPRVSLMPPIVLSPIKSEKALNPTVESS